MDKAEKTTDTRTNAQSARLESGTHTPGPWKAIVNNGRGSEWHIRHQTETHIGGAFCTVEALHTTREAIATCEANARLIAAAPDLLGACNMLDELITDAKCIQSVKWTNARNAIRRAIDKAEGSARQ